MVLGFSVGMEAFDELLSINVPWSQEFSGLKSGLTPEEARALGLVGCLLWGRTESDTTEVT